MKMVTGQVRITLLIALFLFVGISCDKEEEFNDGPFESKRTAILSFAFKALNPPVEGVVNAKAGTVTLLVPFGTNKTNLVPTIEVSPKATIAPPSGTANNFSGETTYVVTAENGVTQTWKIIVNEAPEEAQPRLSLSTPVWNLSPSGTGIPPFFTIDGERGLDFGNNHLYISTNNDKIFVLNPADGSQIGSLNMTGVDGGNPKIADVEVSDDGSILACNSVEWTSANGAPPTTFKIYRWATETSQPEVFLSYTNTEYRMGDSFSVVGDVTTNAVIFTTFGRKFLEPSTRGNLIFRWNVTNGVVDAQPQIIQVQGLPSLTRFGSRPHAAMIAVNSTEIYSNANDIDFTLSNLDGSLIGRIPNASRELYDGFTSYFEVFEFAGKKILAVAFPRSNIESRLIVIDITKGLQNVTKEDVILSENFLSGSGEIANINASAAVAINKLADKVEVYCLITNQALVKFNLTTVL